MAGKLDTLEAVGNALCLDLVNTVNRWPTPTVDHLDDYGAVLAWSEHVGLLSARHGRALRRLLADGPETGWRLLAGCHALRSLLQRIFTARAGGEPADADDLVALQRAYASASSAARLRRTAHRYEHQWDLGGDLAAPLHVIAHDAVGLLTSDRLDRVGTCPSCGWVFLDVSRNGQRRWCSMNTCGSRDKMQRLYARRKRL